MENLELQLENFNTIKKVDFNYEELKGKLCSILSNYKTAVYTEDSIKAAKEDKAMLNKIAKSLNNKRIEIEKDYMKPFEDFKAKVKELVELTKDTVLNIDTQVKEFEEKQRQEKLIVVKKIIAEVNSLNVEERFLFEESYLLKGTNEKQVADSVLLKLERIKEDFSILENMQPTDFEDIKKYYFRVGGNLGETIGELNRIKEIAKRLEEKVHEKIAEQKPIETQQANIFAETAEEVEEFTLTLFTTKTKMKQLKEFLRQNNIKNL